jgi:hypothetical protein
MKLIVIVDSYGDCGDEDASIFPLYQNLIGKEIVYDLNNAQSVVEGKNDYLESEFDETIVMYDGSELSLDSTRDDPNNPICAVYTLDLKNGDRIIVRGYIKDSHGSDITQILDFVKQVIKDNHCSCEKCGDPEHCLKEDRDTWLARKNYYNPNPTDGEPLSDDGY